MRKLLSTLTTAALVIGAGLGAAPAFAEPQQPSVTTGEGAPPAAVPIEDPASPPQILNGAPMVGVAVLAAPGKWQRQDLTFSYEWLVNGQSTGATGVTYTPSAEDSGKQLVFRATASAAGESTRVFDSAPVIVQPGEIVSSPVHVAGLAAVGNTLTAETAAWEPADAQLNYQWLRNDAEIAGATVRSYTLAAADFGTSISVRVTATLAGYGSKAETAPAVSIAAGTVTAQVPTVSGTPAVGKTLTAKTAAWGPGQVTLGYQWLRSGAAITGATKSTYALTAADLGKTVSVKISGSLAGYTSASKTSAATKAVVVGTLASATPTVSGSAVVGSTLTAKTAAWGPGKVTLGYQWLRSGAAITGATKSTYKLTSSDAGKSITVRVTGRQTGFATKTATAKATAAVLRTLTAAPVPGISGTVRVGSTLTAGAGAWKPAPVSLGYQWLRDGAVIKGATKSTYKLTGSDAGKKIAVRVTGKKSGYLSASKTSASRSVPRAMQAATPRVSGATKYGSTLTVSRGSWTSGAALTTQWLRNGSPISGAKGASYKLTAADVGKRISVRVSGTKSGYAGETRTSAATAVITYPSSTPSANGSCPSWAPVKGNASSMIYHVPGGAYYSRTKAEECFVNAAAAQRAGYRASKR